MYSVFLDSLPLPLTVNINSYTQELKLNLLPLDKLYYDFNYLSCMSIQENIYLLGESTLSSFKEVISRIF